MMIRQKLSLNYHQISSNTHLISSAEAFVSTRYDTIQHVQPQRWASTKVRISLHGCSTFVSLCCLHVSHDVAYGQKYYLSRVMRKPTFWFSTWSHTNQAVQLQNMARGLKFQILKVEGLYYLYSENKGADMRLCFRICKMLVFS